MGDAQLLHGLAQALGHMQGMLRRHPVQDHGELLPAVAEDLAVAAAQAVAHGLGHPVQAGVSFLMSQRIVVDLEQVHIQHDEAGRLPQLRQPHVQGAPVGDARQAVHEAHA